MPYTDTSISPDGTRASAHQMEGKAVHDPRAECTYYIGRHTNGHGLANRCVSSSRRHGNDQPICRANSICFSACMSTKCCRFRTLKLSQSRKTLHLAWATRAQEWARAQEWSQVQEEELQVVFPQHARQKKNEPDNRGVR